MILNEWNKIHDTFLRTGIFFLEKIAFYVKESEGPFLLHCASRTLGVKKSPFPLDL